MTKTREQLAKALSETGYVADDGLATALLLMVLAILLTRFRILRE